MDDNSTRPGHGVDANAEALEAGMENASSRGFERQAQQRLGARATAPHEGPVKKPPVTVGGPAVGRTHNGSGNGRSRARVDNALQEIGVAWNEQAQGVRRAGPVNPLVFATESFKRDKRLSDRTAWRCEGQRRKVSPYAEAGQGTARGRRARTCGRRRSRACAQQARGQLEGHRVARACPRWKDRRGRRCPDWGTGLGLAFFAG